MESKWAFSPPQSSNHASFPEQVMISLLKWTEQQVASLRQAVCCREKNNGVGGEPKRSTCARQWYSRKTPTNTLTAVFSRLLLQFSVWERRQSREGKRQRKNNKRHRMKLRMMKLDAWTPGLTNRHTLQTVNTDGNILRRRGEKDSKSPVPKRNKRKKKGKPFLVQIFAG